MESGCNKLTMNFDAINSNWGLSKGLFEHGTSFSEGEYDSYINGIDPCDASDTKAASANDSAATHSATSSSSFSTAASPNFEFQASVVYQLSSSNVIGY